MAKRLEMRGDLTVCWVFFAGEYLSASLREEASNLNFDDVEEDEEDDEHGTTGETILQQARRQAFAIPNPTQNGKSNPLQDL